MAQYRVLASEGRQKYKERQKSDAVTVLYILLLASEYLNWTGLKTIIHDVFIYPQIPQGTGGEAGEAASSCDSLSLSSGRLEAGKLSSQSPERDDGSANNNISSGSSSQLIVISRAEEFWTSGTMLTLL